MRDGAPGAASLPLTVGEGGSAIREAAGPGRTARAASARRHDSRAGDRELVAHLERSEIFREYQQAFAATAEMPLAIQIPDTETWPVLAGREPCGGPDAAPGRRCPDCVRLRRWVDEGASGEAMTVRCCTGFSESAVPLRLGARVFGFLRTGGRSWRAPSRERFTELGRKTRARPTGREVARLRAADLARCAVARERHEAALRLVVLFARHLSLLGNQMMIAEIAGESPQMVRARSFIAEHHGEELSLVDVAQAVHLSPYYLCTVFKEATGETFAQHLARVRIEQVKQSLLQPHLRISEAAFAAGFQSLSQFNRSFRHFAGESPSAYRERWCDANGEDWPELALRGARQTGGGPGRA